MPELRGMRAVVQFLRQSAEPCTAPPTSLFMALLMDFWAVTALFVFLRLRLSCSSAKRPRILLTQDLANQNADLPDSHS